MTPRAVVALLLVTLAAVTTSHAQPADRKTVAVLTPSAAQWREEAFRGALRSLGYVEGVNVVFDIRSADGHLERLPELARAVVRRGVDVIVGVNMPSMRAALAASKSVPIVMAMVGDPVRLGLVASLARPGGTVTGVSNMSGELAAKRLELLREVAPHARRIALLYHPDEAIVPPQVEDLEAKGHTLGLQFRMIAVRGEADLERAFDAAAAWPADAVLRLAGQASTVGAQTARLALKRRLPAMMFTRRDVEAGGLMAYYIDEDEAFRRVAHYVDQILKGAAPRDLPVEQPTRFELAINLRTARALRLTVPPSLLLRANHVIE